MYRCSKLLLQIVYVVYTYLGVIQEAMIRRKVKEVRVLNVLKQNYNFWSRKWWALLRYITTHIWHYYIILYVGRYTLSFSPMFQYLSLKGYLYAVIPITDDIICMPTIWFDLTRYNTHIYVIHETWYKERCKLAPADAFHSNRSPKRYL